MDETEARGNQLVFPDRGCAYLPGVAQSAAKHRILDSDQRFVDFLGNSCTSWKHEAPAMWTSYTRSLCDTLRLAKVQWTVRAGGRVAKTYKKPLWELQINTGEVTVRGLQHTGEGGDSLDFTRAEPAAP